MKRTIIAASLTALLLGSCTPEVHKVAITAHRGYWNCEESGFTENSIASLSSAQANQFWGSEFDVHVTSDSVLVVNHNNDVQGIDIKTNPYSAIKDIVLKNGEKVSTIDEYLAQGEKSDGTVLVFELKAELTPELEDYLVDQGVAALKRHGLFDPERVIFISFSLHMCKKIAAEYPQFTNQYLSGDIAPETLYKEYGINGIDYMSPFLWEHPEWIEQAHRCGMSVNTWTPNLEEDWKKLIDLGVDCITTDEPMKLRQLLGENEFLTPKAAKARRKARK